MICSTIRRTLSILTACSLLAAPAVLFTGCGSNSDSAAPQQTTASNAQSREAALNPYLEATNDYNHNIVTFNFSIAPSLDSLRKGEHKEHISLPNFDHLKDALEKARSDQNVAGVYPDIDAAADDLLAVLKDLEPLATKLESYYSAKTYMTDNYAQSDEMVAQFFPLYDKFDAAYDKFDAVVTDRYKELRLAQIDALRSEGKENAASFLELNGKTRELVEMLDHGGLARHRHVEAREAHGACARDGGAYGRGDDVVAQVDAVEPELGEGRIVHGGGERMLHGRAEKGKSLCAAGYHRASFDGDGVSRSDRARGNAWSDALAGTPQGYLRADRPLFGRVRVEAFDDVGVALEDVGALDLHRRGEQAVLLREVAVDHREFAD